MLFLVIMIFIVDCLVCVGMNRLVRFMVDLERKIVGMFV